ncbi:hypothetical protein DB771_01850 [Burkholderia sp. AU29985]|nr:hypothetical protein XM57_22280 [Burkholderia cepacia]AYZ94289.1 hypothetical protein EGY28_03950 [Burkholderia dolosa]ETP63635.1 hypothetical protein BDSB_16090 [Burkholderia dolosa PC543]PRE39734.1 hypothetical protein C6P87_29620 [Burkholderia sp. AU12872]PUA78631.1 hypothetical protein DB771_01850 [Burkholderia sp. AU29985]
MNAGDVPVSYPGRASRDYITMRRSQSSAVRICGERDRQVGAPRGRRRASRARAAAKKHAGRRG